MSQVNHSYEALIALANVIKSARIGDYRMLSSSVDALAGQARNLMQCLQRFDQAKQDTYGSRPDRMNAFAEALFFLQRRKCIFYGQLELTKAQIGSTFPKLERQAAESEVTAFELSTLRSSLLALEATALGLITAATTHHQGCITVHGTPFEAEVLAAYAKIVAAQAEQTQISAYVLSLGWTGNNIASDSWWAKLGPQETTASYAKGAAAIAALQESLGHEPVQQALAEITAPGRNFSVATFFAALRKITGRTEEALRAMAGVFNEPPVS